MIVANGYTITTHAFPPPPTAPNYNTSTGDSHAVAINFPFVQNRREVWSNSQSLCRVILQKLSRQKFTSLDKMC